MALTRRTSRLGELAAAVEAELKRRGVAVDPGVVDRALNARVERSAGLLGISPRAALRYAPDELPGWVADELHDGDGPGPVAQVIDLHTRSKRA